MAKEKIGVATESSPKSLL